MPQTVPYLTPRGEEESAMRSKTRRSSASKKSSDRVNVFGDRTGNRHRWAG